MKSFNGWTMAKYLSTVIDIVIYTDPVLATPTKPIPNGMIWGDMLFPYLTWHKIEILKIKIHVKLIIKSKKLKGIYNSN